MYDINDNYYVKIDTDSTAASCNADNGIIMIFLYLFLSFTESSLGRQ